MITALTGHLERVGPSQVYLNVGGVEYEIYVPLDVLSQVQKKPGQSSLSLCIYHHFKENEQSLFGFLNLRQREFFKALIALRGFGTGLALSLLSHLSGERFLVLCAVKDARSLCRIPRIGKNTAESLIFEVNRQKKKWNKLLLTAPHEQTEDEFSTEQDMALQALVQLGYREKEAQQALCKIMAEKKTEDASLKLDAAEWIRFALRIL